MSNARLPEIEAVIGPYLLLADCVYVVTRDAILLGCFEQGSVPQTVKQTGHYSGQISSIGTNEVVFQLLPEIKSALSSGIGHKFEFNYSGNCTNERILVHQVYDPKLPDLLLVVLDRIPSTKEQKRPDTGWREILDSMGECVWELDVVSREMVFSKRWQTMFGYSESEVTTLDQWSEKIFPEDYKNAHDAFYAYFNGATPFYSCELRYRCKNGDTKWIQSRGVFIEKSADGKPLKFIGTHTDIDQRRKIADENRNNVGMLLRLMNSLPSGILVTDEHKKLVFANKGFCTLYGIDKHPRELSGLDTSKMLEQDMQLYKDPEGLKGRIEELLRDKKTVLSEEVEMRDGRILSRDYIPLNFNENYKGEIWRFTDITEQKNIDRRFKDQKLFYEHVLDCLPANVTVFNREGKIVYINPVGLANNIDRRWLIGKTLTDYSQVQQLSAEVTTQREHAYQNAIVSGKQVDWTEHIKLDDGSEAYRLKRLYPAFKADGELDITIMYGINITDRVKAEQALNASLTALANSFNYSGIGKALVSPYGKWIEVNDKLAEMTGYRKEELYAMQYRDVTYPDDVEKDRPFLDRLLKKEIATYSIEKRFISKSRQIITTSLTVSLVWENDRVPKYFVCDIVDISKQKQLTDEIQRKNAELEATGRSLNNKIHQLEELNHIIAHNLRGPASNIRMLSERLIMDDNDPAVEDEPFTKQEAGDIIHESSIKLSNSLDTLMELMQIRLNSDIPYIDCNFEEMIRDISTQHYGVIYEKQAIIHLDLAVPVIKYPKVYLESILYNLFSNALKYTKPDQFPEINIATRMDGDKIQLVVKDNGLGIDVEKYKDKLFKLNQVFHRGHDSKGVGLYLTKNQVESLGGTIEVHSKANEGCEFIVTF